MSDLLDRLDHTLALRPGDTLALRRGDTLALRPGDTLALRPGDTADEHRGRGASPGWPSRRALLVDEGGSHDAEAIAAAAAAVAARLVTVSQPGARVLIDAPRTLSWLASFVGCVQTGRVAVPLPEGAPALEIAAMASRAEATVALVAEGGLASIPEGITVVPVSGSASGAGAGAGSASRPGAGAGAGSASGAGAGAGAGAGSASRAGAGAGSASRPGADLDPGAPSGAVPEGGDAALFLFTSGTTGRPKPAILTHDNLAAQTRALIAAWELGPDDVLLHALPLHHTHGVIVALLATLLGGGRVHMLPRFDATRVWDALASATVWMAVPTMTSKLIEVFDAASADRRARWSANARGLRLATSGSAALPVSLAGRWRDLAGTVPLERYGMTEIGMALSNPLDPAGRRAGHVGTPLPGVEVRIVDDAGRDAGDGPGELWVRGPSVFAGYFNDPAASAAAFTDGWFRTGDVAVRDAGAFRLLGRSSVDILKTGGEKVSALEIEEVLREHEAIAEVAVIGVPDATWGDRVVAVIVPAAGRVDACDPAAIRAWAKERLAPFKVPKDVVVVDALPRNAMGKVQKTALAALL